MMSLSPLSSSKKIDLTRLSAGIFLPTLFTRKAATSSILKSASVPVFEQGGLGRLHITVRLLLICRQFLEAVRFGSPLLLSFDSSVEEVRERRHST